ncbi:hypothetical protein N1028_18515 [Herbiconiux sp. CPCC 203407]|uniref:Uncharacterized protein n=1 Tax=Herbiconiux oxytropis TaxID=2970915 RepID=A0AA42BUT4_9MICO|nr:hypothetical protein [Herbiconiux oxytropis]MCS5723240.1 hypothetical protein [Herbiconiux oxytropis]MCS5727895.1 hypothetical protein [Herbiconiux oxytropis]
MSGTSDSGIFWRLAPALLVAILALVAILLSVSALRQGDVASNGTVPGPIPTWDETSGTDSAATPTPTSAAVALFPVFDIDASGIGLVSAPSSCGDQTSSVSVTEDSGRTWSPVDFGPLGVQAIYEVRVVSSDQLDVVAGLGPDCTPSLLTSYTAGQFWQSNPERLAETTWLDPSDPTVIHHLGAVIPTPCGRPLAVTPSASGAATICQEGAFTYSTEQLTWSVLAPGRFLGLDSSLSGTLVLESSTEDCAGVRFSEFGPDGAALGSVCDVSHVPAENSAIASVDQRIYRWDGAQVQQSDDGGLTWSS